MVFFEKSKILNNFINNDFKKKSFNYLFKNSIVNEIIGFDKHVESIGIL